MQRVKRRKVVYSMGGRSGYSGVGSAAATSAISTAAPVAPAPAPRAVSLSFPQGTITSFPNSQSLQLNYDYHISTPQDYNRFIQALNTLNPGASIAFIDSNDGTATIYERRGDSVLGMFWEKTGGAGSMPLRMADSTPSGIRRHAFDRSVRVVNF